MDDYMDILSDHDGWHREQYTTYKRNFKAYSSKFWQYESVEQSSVGWGVKVEVARGYGLIMSYQASLFSNAPSPILGPDPANRGNVEVAQAVMSKVVELAKIWPVCQTVCRHSLLYGMGGAKVWRDPDAPPWTQVRVDPLYPWEVVVDQSARTLDRAKYVGTITYQDLAELRRNKKYTVASSIQGTRRQDYFGTQQPRCGEWVRVLELLDLVEGRLYVYAVDQAKDDQTLFKGPAPYLDVHGRPVPNVRPLILTPYADCEAHGMATLDRVYDQIRELNYLRTFWANATRRDARNYLYDKELLNDRVMKKLAQGRDGSAIPVEGLARMPENAIRTFPVEKLSANYDGYEQRIEQDLVVQGSTPNSRGEATKATATEVLRMNDYFQTEVGMLARVRDEWLGGVFASMTAVVRRTLEDSAKNELRVSVEGRTKSRRARIEDFDADYTIGVSSMLTTPTDEAQRRANLTGLSPLLLKLAEAVLRYDPMATAILDELVSAFRLPDAFRPERLREEMEAVLKEMVKQQKEEATPEAAMGATLQAAGAELPAAEAAGPPVPLSPTGEPPMAAGV